MAKSCGVEPRDYIRRMVINDIENPHTVTLLKPIEEVIIYHHRCSRTKAALSGAAAVFCVSSGDPLQTGFNQYLHLITISLAYVTRLYGPLVRRALEVSFPSFKSDFRLLMKYDVCRGHRTYPGNLSRNR